MKKRTKIILITLASIFLLSIVFANIDYRRTQADKKPILTIFHSKNKNTNAEVYYGLGYIVVKCPEYTSGNKELDKLNGVNSYKLYYLSTRYVCVQSFDVEIPAEE